MISKERLLDELSLFSLGTGGIGSWITKNTNDEVFQRLGQIESEPLTKVQLNQLLVLGHEAPIRYGFFKYYWLTNPEDHPYPVSSVPGFQEKWIGSEAIISLDHLKWGLYRLFTDSLLFFGNVRTGFRYLRALTEPDLKSFYSGKKLDTELIKARGPALPLKSILKDNRYLISEMACKSYGDSPESSGQLKNALIDAFKRHQAKGGKSVKIRNLLENSLDVTNSQSQQMFLFSADDVLDDEVATEGQIHEKYERVAQEFTEARLAALTNTQYYLSMVNDLDVYVATSMRTREDFRKVASTCEEIFSSSQLKGMQLRYFDPTLSAASSHEDKGLIECLMVKCAKVLLYCAGDKESYGKDAEAAMALSLGKPVIFLCDQEQRSRFYRDVHPLSRLIEFNTGIAVGAMVTDNIPDVISLFSRIFENKMEYRLEHPKPGYLKLKEKVTDSVVRLQTNDLLLSETFWNNYHNRKSD